MTREKTWSAAVVAALLVGVGCQSTVGLEGQECPELNEFGSGGCARVVAIVEPPVETFPANYRISVRSEWPGGELISLQESRDFGTLDFRLDLVSPSVPVGPGDTASVWMIAHVAEVEGTSVSIVAADSVLHLATFSSVGVSPTPDTVRLSPG